MFNIGAFMKLQFILARFIVILFMYCGEFPRGMHISLVKVGLEIHGRKGDSPKCVFYLFCWVQTFGLYFWGSILFLVPNFGHYICHFNYFFANSMVLFN